MRLGLGQQLRYLMADVRAMWKGLPANTYELGRFEQLFGNLREYLGHYDAGDTGRLQSDWPTTYDTHYNNYAPSRESIIARSIKMAANDPVAKAVLETILSDVVGTGIRPQARVTFDNGTPIEGVNKRLDADWERYNDEWDSTEQDTFYGAQAIVLRDVITCGGTLINRVRSAPGSHLSIASQVVPVLRLATSHDGESPGYSEDPRVTQTVYGININERGAPVSYWIKGIGQPISARNIYQVYRKTMPEQYTAEPWFVAALKYLWANDQLIKDKLIASRIQAMIGMIMPDNMVNQLVANQLNSNNQLSMTSGRIYRYSPIGNNKPEILQADDSIKEVLIPLQRLLLHAVSASLGWSYQTITRDVTEINQAAGRINTNRDRTSARAAQKWFAKGFCQREWERFVEQEFVQGRIPGKTVADFLADPWRYTQCQWRAPGWEFIDPAREASALVEMRKAKLQTLEQYCGERGVDWKAHVEQLAAEEAYLREKGVRIEQTAQAPAPQGAGGGNANPDPNEDEDRVADEDRVDHNR